MINLFVKNEENFSKAGLDKPNLDRFTKEFTSMTEELDKALGGTWNLTIRPANFGAAVAKVSIKGEVDGKAVLIEREILPSFKDKPNSFNLKHEYFFIDEKLQGKGIANIVNKVSYNLGKDGVLESALVHANLDVGGYAWLRKGAWPTDGKMALQEIATNAKMYNSSSKVNELADDFLDLLERFDDEDLRAYVLTESFSKYKEVFLNSDWAGRFDLPDPLVRASLIGDKPAQAKLLLDRLKKRPNVFKTMWNAEILDLEETAKLAKPPVEVEVIKKPTVVPALDNLAGSKAIKTPALTANERILNDSIKQQTYLLRYSDGLADDLMETLSKTDKPLNDALISWLSEAEGNPLYDKAGRAWQAEFEEAVAGIREPAWDEIQQALAAQMEGLAVSSAAGTAVIIQGAIPVVLGMQLPPPDKLVAIARSQPLQGKVLSEWMEKAKRNDVDSLVTQAKAGIIQGKTPVDVTREIMGTRAQEFADGAARKKAQRDVQTLVRTITNGVQNEAKQALYEANSDIIEKEQYVATLDARTTIQCAVNDNKVFKRGEGPMPPLHFNCRSLRVPFFTGEQFGDRAFDASTEKTLVKEYAEKNGLTGVKTKADLPRGTKGDFDQFARQRRRELIGQVPSTTSYQDWLKKQSPEFQDEILGKGKAALFRNGELSLDKFVSRDGEPLTLAQLTKKTGGLVSPEKAIQAAAPIDRTAMRLAYGDPYTYGEARHNTLFEEFRPKLKAMDKVDRQHLRNYAFKDENFQSINNALRAGTPLTDKLAAQKQSMDNSLAANTVKVDTLFRGDSSLPTSLEDAQALIGKTLENKGYMSTSVNPEMAAGFGGGKTSAVLEFHPDKKPINGIYLGALDPDPRNSDSYLNLMEREVLLPAGKKYTISGIRQEQIFNPDYMREPVVVTVYEASFTDK